MEDSRQSRQHGMALLLHRRKIPADAAKSGDPSPDSRKVPEIFCCTLAQRRSRSAWLFVKGIRRSSSKASTCSARKSRASSRFLALLCLRRPLRFAEEDASGGG